MTTATYGTILSIICFLLIAATVACLVWGNMRVFFGTLIPAAVVCGLMISAGQSPVFDTMRGERTFGDTLYYDNMKLSDNDLNSVYSFLDKSTTTDFMEKYCKQEVAAFIEDPIMSNLRKMGHCWKNLEITRVKKRFLVE